MTETFQVTGMTCGHCERAVTEAIQTLDANAQVKIDRASGKVSYGRIPAGSVVVSGSLPAADGSHSLYCAVIVKQVDEKTRSKTSVNDLLRGAVERVLVFTVFRTAIPARRRRIG